MAQAWTNAADLGAEIAGFWARAESCRRALVEVARVAAQAGGQLVVIKGVHLAFCVAEFPGYRPMADGDALLVRGDFGSVRAALARRWRVRQDDWSSISVTLDAERAVDVHRRPLPAYFGRLDAGAVLRRAVARHDVFGANVLVPDPTDAAVIAIAHYAKDKVGAFGHGMLATDLALLRDRAGVTPAVLAARVREHGLRRAALVALSNLDAEFTPFLDACAPSEVERAWARLTASRMARSAPGRRTLGFLLTRSIGDSAGDIVANLVLGTMIRAPYLARDLLQRKS